MLTGQSINYILIYILVSQEGMSKKEKKKKRKEKEKEPQPNKKPKRAISVACILIRCQPLPNNISIKNGKNDVL